MCPNEKSKPRSGQSKSVIFGFFYEICGREVKNQRELLANVQIWSAKPVFGQ